MSIESAKAFIKRMKTDREFAKELSECKDYAEVRKFLQNAGFNFTDDELKACSAELTDEDLQSVAGGFPICATICELAGGTVGHDV